MEFVRNQNAFQASAIGLIGMSQGGWIAPVAASRTHDVSFVVNMAGAAVTTDEQLLHEEIHNIAHYTYTPIAWLLVRITTRRLKRLEHLSAFMGFDPVPYWEGVDVPVFFAYGGNDENVPVDASVARLRERGLNRFSVNVYPDGGHAIRDTRTNRVNREFLDDLVAFIQESGVKGRSDGRQCGATARSIDSHWRARSAARGPAAGRLLGVHLPVGRAQQGVDVDRCRRIESGDAATPAKIRLADSQFGSGKCLPQAGERDFGLGRRGGARAHAELVAAQACDNVRVCSSMYRPIISIKVWSSPTPQHINAIKHGRRGVGKNLLKRFAQALNVSEAELLAETTEFTQRQTVPIPVFSPEETDLIIYYISNDTEVGKERKISFAISRGIGTRAFGVKITDESMAPRFLPGDVAVVDPDCAGGL